MKVLIIDNERLILEELTDMLQALCPEVTQIESAQDISGGLALIRHFQPDLLLLDVELDAGTGMDLLQQVAHPTFQLIFITAHDKYAVQAFRMSAIDFLRKPIDPDELVCGVQKAAKNIKNQHLSTQIEFLLAHIKRSNDTALRIALKDNEHIYYVRTDEICYCEANGVYTRFYLENEKIITISKNLKEYEQLLEPMGFIRVHNSYLIHPDKIIRFERSSDTLILEGNRSVPLSQRKKELVLRLLEQR